MTINEIREKIEEMELKYEYAYIGIRTQTHEFELGEIYHTSYAWNDGEMTDEELDGICCTDIDSNYATAHTGEHFCCSYIGNHVAIIAGNHAEWGTDEGEVIIKDPEVVMIIK